VEESDGIPRPDRASVLLGSEEDTIDPEQRVLLERGVPVLASEPGTSDVLIEVDVDVLDAQPVFGKRCDLAS